MNFQMKLSQSIYITLTPTKGIERKKGRYNYILKVTLTLIACVAFPLSFSEVCNIFHDINSY